MKDSRGVSEVTGTVLLLGVTVLAITSVLALGGTAVDQARDRVATERAELVAGEFVQSVVHVTDGRASTRTVDTGRMRTAVHADRGWLRVTAGNDTLVNETLGTVRFSGGRSYVVLQGGTVFRVDGDAATVLRAASVSYRGDTLSVNALRVRGDVATRRPVALHAAGRTQVFPAPAAGLTNPVEDRALTLTVRSRYYRAWGRSFAARTNATPTYDAANRTVSLTFVPDRASPPVQAGVRAGTPTGTLVLSGGMTMDSYNSSVGPYAGGTGAARVVAAGNVTVTGGAGLNGGLTAGGDVTVKGGSTLTGPLAVGDDLTVTGGADVDTTTPGSDDGARVVDDVTVDAGATFDGPLVYGGTLTDPGGAVSNATPGQVSVTVPSTSPVTARLTRTVEQARRENANASVAAVDDGALDCTRNVDGDTHDDECRLPAGTYFLDELSLQSNEELVLDTSAGGITLAVDGPVSLDGASTVRVVGDGRVNVHATGNYSQSGSASVVNPGDDAPQFWVYLRPDAAATLDGGGRFVGVLYGPGAAIDVGSVPVYGAVVGDVEFVASGVEIHYDAALARSTPVPVPDGTAPVQFVHASVDYVNVTATA